jgi:hypothetical protein
MATDPDITAARLAASATVPDKPIDQPPAVFRGITDSDSVRHAILAELACLDSLGDWDIAVIGWTARCGPDYALTIASLIRRAYHAGLTHGAGEHTRDGSCCGLLAGDV